MAEEAPKTSSLRSLHSHYPIKVLFLNASTCIVDLYWLNYSGKLVCYRHDLNPGDFMNINTYVAHPWVVHDSVTGQRLRLSGQPVYIPTIPPALRIEGLVGEYGVDLSAANLEKQKRQELSNLHERVQLELQDAPPVNILIHIPVYRLEDICIGFFRRHLSAEARCKLEVSQYLLRRLTNPTIESTDHA